MHPHKRAPQVLFPQSYASTGEWLRSLSGRARAALDAAVDALAAAADADPEFRSLAGGLEVGVWWGRHETHACRFGDL